MPVVSVPWQPVTAMLRPGEVWTEPLGPPVSMAEREKLNRDAQARWLERREPLWAAQKLVRELEEEIRAVDPKEQEDVKRRIEDWEDAQQPPAKRQARGQLPQWLESRSESSSGGRATGGRATTPPPYTIITVVQVVPSSPGSGPWRWGCRRRPGRAPQPALHQRLPPGALACVLCRRIGQ